MRSCEAPAWEAYAAAEDCTVGSRMASSARTDCRTSRKRGLGVKDDGADSGGSVDVAPRAREVAWLGRRVRMWREGFCGSGKWYCGSGVS